MKLMVIDGNSILNRAYYGIRPLTTRDGLYTHAIFGFLTTLLRLEWEEAPDALCVTFDVHAPTFRHQASEAYKATRKPMPEELRMQVPVLKEVLDALRIPRYELEGWEADDLIGTISRRCEADGWDCVVVTGDKDSLQLITDRTMVKLVSTRMGQTTTKDMTETAFREQYGFAPIHMIDLKALMGDSSDNIPGVPGIGEKTAMDLIQKYESIDNLYARMPDIDAKPAAIKKLAEGEESARESYWLATIVTDAPLDFRPGDNLMQKPGPDAYPLFLKLEFTKLIEKFGLAPAEQPAAEREAFVHTAIRRITIPASVTAVESFAFWNCRNLEQVELMCGSHAASAHAFYRCPGVRLRQQGQELPLPQQLRLQGVDLLGGRTSWRCPGAISGRGRRLWCMRPSVPGEIPGPWWNLRRTWNLWAHIRSSPARQISGGTGPACTVIPVRFGGWSSGCPNTRGSGFPLP